MSGPIHNENGRRARVYAWGILLLSLSLLLGGCVLNAPPEDVFLVKRTTPPTGRAEVPAEFFARRVVVTVTINGVGPFRLLLDSGARGLLLSRPAAERANLPLLPLVWVKSYVLGGSGTQKQRIARVPRLQAGGLQLEGLSACVIAPEEWKKFDEALHAMRAVGPCDGILGMAAFHDLLLEIDYPGQTVAVHRPDTADFSDVGFARCEFPRSVPYVNLQLPGRTLRVLVDTGDNGDLTLPTLENLPLLHGRQRFDGLIFGLGGSSVRSESGQIDGAVRLGSITWNRLPVDTGRSPPRLGFRALSFWRVVLDQQRERLYLVGPNQEVTVPEVFVEKPEDKMGFFGEVDGGSVRLLEVDSGGVLHWAGLRAGDLIRQVDGLTAVEWFRRRGEGMPHPATTTIVGERAGTRFATKLEWAQKQNP